MKKYTKGEEKEEKLEKVARRMMKTSKEKC